MWYKTKKLYGHGTKLLDLNNGQWEDEIWGVRLISKAWIKWFNLILSMLKY